MHERSSGYNQQHSNGDPFCFAFVLPQSRFSFLSDSLGIGEPTRGTEVCFAHRGIAWLLNQSSPVSCFAIPTFADVQYGLPFRLFTWLRIHSTFSFPLLERVQSLSCTVLWRAFDDDVPQRATNPSVGAPAPTRIATMSVCASQSRRRRSVGPPPTPTPP